MKTILALLILSCLNSTIGNCQLLSKPSLTVEDFEIALTNANHLGKILSKHNFESYATGASKLNAPGTMSNQLYPDLRILKSENWVLKNSRDQSIFIINMFEWEPNHAPQPDVIKTIRILVNRDSKYADQMKAFLEKIKIRYPNKSKRYFRNNEFYQQFGEPLIVFTNGSNIEVRTEAPDARYFNFYTVSLDLMYSKTAYIIIVN
jgi:hypothetical protein